MNTIVDYYNSNIESYITKELFLVIVSAVPFIELRGGMIAASLLKVPYLTAVFLCIIGNVLPIPFILLLGRKIMFLLKSYRFTASYFIKLEKRLLTKSNTIQKYEFVGLSLFVGIPLPGSGVWSGSLIATLLDFSIKRAVLAQFSGLALSVLIMSIFTYVPFILF